MSDLNPLLRVKKDTSTLASTLLRRVQADDPEAWQRFVYLYAPLVSQWCRQCQLQAADVDDVVQEVLRSVMTGIQRFRRDGPTDTFRGWLWKVTRNKVLDHVRRQAVTPVAPGGTEAQIRMQEIPEVLDESSVVEEETGLMHRALQLLRSDFEEHTWKAFWAMVVEGKPASEVAAELGMTPGAVRQARHRVLHRLREEFVDLIPLDSELQGKMA
jgi:RNA polymerase sigma-70 factor (ECF subfamily)